MLTTNILDWLRTNTVEEFHNDINLIKWLINCQYLQDVKRELKKEIDNGILTSQKHKDELKFINYLIKRK
jgi:hypothetical protein